MVKTNLSNDSLSRWNWTKTVSLNNVNTRNLLIFMADDGSCLVEILMEESQKGQTQQILFCYYPDKNDKRL